MSDLDLCTFPHFSRALKLYFRTGMSPYYYPKHCSCDTSKHDVRPWNVSRIPGMEYLLSVQSQEPNETFRATHLAWLVLIRGYCKIADWGA